MEEKEFNYHWSQMKPESQCLKCFTGILRAHTDGNTNTGLLYCPYCNCILNPEEPEKQE